MPVARATGFVDGDSFEAWRAGTNSVVSALQALGDWIGAVTGPLQARHWLCRPSGPFGGEAWVTREQTQADCDSRGWLGDLEGRVL